MTLKRNKIIIARVSAIKNMFLLDVIINITLTVKKNPILLRKIIK
jgi:hypothetical protein